MSFHSVTEFCRYMRINIQRLAFVAAILGIIAVVLIPHEAAAQVGKIPGATCTLLGINCTGTDTDLNLIDLIIDIINVVLGLAGVIAAGFVIYGGIKYITSAGSDQQAAEAKRVILYAIIGLIVIGLSAVIVNVVINIF